MNEEELGKVARDIRRAAKDVGALVVSAIPGGRRMADLVAVERSEFLVMIQHLAPKIVYLDEARFEAAPMLASLIDDDDEDSTNDPDVQAAARRWKRHEGELCQLIAVVVHDGIHHGCDDQVEWMDELTDVAAEIRERRDERRAAQIEALNEREREELRLGREQQAKADLALVRANGSILKADPRFDQSLTKAKRRQLAVLLFPDLPSAMITKIVDQTVSAEWLSLKSD